AGYTEESLLITKLAAAVAGVAGDRLLSMSSAGPATGIAGVGLAYRNFGALAEDRILELDRDVRAQVCAPLRTASAASAAKGIAKSEEVAEDFAEILEG